MRRRCVECSSMLEEGRGHICSECEERLKSELKRDHLDIEGSKLRA